MLDDARLASFEEEGFLVMEDLLGPEVLGPVIEEYAGLMARLKARWTAEGRWPEGEGGGLEADLIAAYRAGLDWFQPLDISLPPGEIAPDTPFHAGPAVFAMLTAPALLDAVEALIGPEITSNPIQHVRIKPPVPDLRKGEIRAHIAATDWHQDRAVTLEEADRTRMVTAWLAVTDATVENGCLKVIPGSHRGEMLTHCPQDQLGIPRRFFDEDRARPLPVGAGGVILFHPLTIHGSLPNHSRGLRWSFDLRYNVTGEPTGRSFFPDFVARSRVAPQTVLRDAAAWRAMWEKAREGLSAGAPVEIHRWDPGAPACA